MISIASEQPLIAMPPMPDDAAVVSFPEGLPGFEAFRRFVLASDPSFAPFTVLRGLGAGAPSFATIDPRLVSPGYFTSIGEQDRMRLGASDASPLLWLAIVSPGASGGAATANLRAPIVICPETMRGLQIVDALPAAESDAPYRFDHPFRAG